MAFAQLFVWFSLLSVTFSATILTDKSTTPCNTITGEGCVATPPDCQQLCGCDGTLKYDAEKDECVFNVMFLRKTVIYPVPDNEDNDGTSLEDSIAKMRSDQVDDVFRGIIVSAIFFIVCASICVLSVCIYCCHIRHSDRKLKNEVKAIAKRLNIDLSKKDSAPLIRKKQRDPKAESCNVVVTDANVMCV